MALIGFHYTRINASKDKAITGKVKADNNLTLNKVTEAKLMGSSTQKGIEFAFSFKVNYEPGIGTIEFDGKIVYMGTQEKVKETLADWDKKKKLPQDVLEEVYNHLLHRLNIEALLVAKEMQLPSHLPMPRINKKK
jgi:hypothetical protein